MGLICCLCLLFLLRGRRSSLGEVGLVGVGEGGGVVVNKFFLFRENFFIKEIFC